MHIADFAYKKNSGLEKVDFYGSFYGCNTDCGICYGKWNYQNEISCIDKVKLLLPVKAMGVMTRGLDIGSHIGMYPIALKDYVQEMLCFEPAPHAYDALVKNSTLFPNIIPFNLAVGEKCEAYNNIPVINIDKFFCGKNIGISFIKIDVEGQEISILEQLKGIINSATDLLMIIEFDMKHLIKVNKTEIDFFNALKFAGLSCDRLLDEVIRPIFQSTKLSHSYFTNIIILKQGSSVKSTITNSYINKKILGEMI